MPFIDEIAAWLVGEGVGALGSTIFKTSSAAIPQGSGPYLSIRDTGGTGAVRTQNDTPTERPTAQLMSFANNVTDSIRMSTAAYNALGGAKGLFNVRLSGVFYLSITARQMPTDSGKDATGLKATYSFNIDAEKEPS